MISLNAYINEWKLTDDSVKNVDNKKVIIYKEFPETTEELQDLIIERLRKNTKNPYLLDIDTSNIEYFGSLFSCYQASYLRKTDINLNKIEIIDLSTWKTDNIYAVDEMFCECHSLKKVYFSGWNTSNIKQFELMFDECESLEYLDLSNFDLSYAEDTHCMFRNCTSLKKIKGIEDWNIDNIDDMNNMFLNCDDCVLPSWYNRNYWEN